MGSLIVVAIVIGIFFIVSIIVLINGIKIKDVDCIFFSIMLVIFSISCAVPIVPELKNVQQKPTTSPISSETENIQPEPAAIDVYRGLTELEITSVNGIPQDTVVVFKK